MRFIAAIHANQEALDTTPELRAETAQLFRQRERFLAWVRRHPNPNIYVALYPKSEFELVEEDGDDHAGDDAGEPESEEGVDQMTWGDLAVGKVDDPQFH